MMYLGIRYLLARKKQGILILLGIAIGTTAYVGISGMMLGFQSTLMEQLVNNDAHIRISAREDILTAKSMASFNQALHVFWSIPPSGRKDSAKIEYPIGWFDRLGQDQDVVAYSPQVSLNVIFNRHKVSQSGRLIGSNPLLQQQVTNIEKYMITGHFKDLGSNAGRIVMGKTLMENLGARVFETIYLSSGQMQPEPFKIVGIFDTGVKNIDEATVFTSLSDAQRLRGTPSEITDIAVRMSDPYDLQEKVDYWKNSSRDKVLSWQESSASILSVFKTQDIVRNSITFAIIVVAGFGIYNILSILVAQKRRDIAILRSMGYLPSDILKLFLFQGLFLGLSGGLIGIIAGFFLCQLMAQIEVVPGRMGSIGGKMIISFDYMIYIKASLLAIISSVFSSLWPSREAGKLDPINIIRSGGQG